jgi:hypothetical protein
MYNDSVDFVVKSIQKTPLVNLNGLIYQEYQDFFDDFLVNKIVNEYKMTEFDKLESQEHKSRTKLSYQSKLSKELKILFSNVKIKNALEKTYSTELKFSSFDLWQDGKGYFLEPHTDNQRIKLALQIYLGENVAAGTKFFSKLVSNITEVGVWKEDYLQHEAKEIHYKKNCGYSLLNNEQSWHGVAFNHVDNRLSAYVRYQ